MAKVNELDEASWNEWVATRPLVVQELCRRLPPDRLYLLRSTGQRVTLVSYNESGTVTVRVSGEYNVVMFEREVFGVNPDDLEECELPDGNESVGVRYTEESEVRAFVDATRPTILAARKTSE